MTTAAQRRFSHRYSRRVRHALLLAAVFAIVVAGCGGRNTSAYKPAPTATCLKKKGFTGVTTAADKVGFIAAFSANGGLFAHPPGSGNTLTIAFAADPKGALATEGAFTRHAPASLRPHISDVMESQRNAVLLWTVTPSQQILSDALGCLTP